MVVAPHLVFVACIGVVAYWELREGAVPYLVSAVVVSSDQTSVVSSACFAPAFWPVVSPWAEMQIDISRN